MFQVEAPMLIALLAACIEDGSNPIEATRIEGSLDGEALAPLVGGYWTDVDDGPYASWLLEGGYVQVLLASYADACATDTAYYEAMEAALADADTFDDLDAAELDAYAESYPEASSGVDAEFFAATDADLSRAYTLSDAGLGDPGSAWVSVWHRLVSDDAHSDAAAVAESGGGTLAVSGAALGLDLDADLGNRGTLTVDGAELRACDTALPAYTSYADAYDAWMALHDGC
jgi:hypothetical protein